MKKGLLLGTLAFCVIGIALYLRPAAPSPSTVLRPIESRRLGETNETIPLGISVTESSSLGAPSASTFASTGSSSSLSGLIGDASLANYGNPAGSSSQDMTLLARTLTSFLTISKTASQRPLSANEEWSEALRGKRIGCEAWISQGHSIFDSKLRLTDRWHRPLHFHAQSANQWEIRSAGPDQKLWSADDVLISISQ